jgi:hypothetical protein
MEKLIATTSGRTVNAEPHGHSELDGFLGTLREGRVAK